MDTWEKVSRLNFSKNALFIHPEANNGDFAEESIIDCIALYSSETLRVSQQQ